MACITHLCGAVDRFPRHRRVPPGHEKSEPADDRATPVILLILRPVFLRAVFGDILGRAGSRLRDWGLTARHSLAGGAVRASLVPPGNGKHFA
ncbi:hypothetical protein I6A84_33100 [Frankia sp. CNm7]|uniref:Uncharacterized protein n=2 Tax=Frankia nepalensis TaxID=1836974 RepID=A0A937USM5_9ACTN|nr:hypothetical protein [Frankia nepalensis]MBL7510920.1 hypothetical protein [Frankia nepalensis]MBL7522796.1 hypothetical protein [Frankia nepalensis]MBL7630420.1 hypothetical protein [Frankia nepalensis]